MKARIYICVLLAITCGVGLLTLMRQPVIADLERYHDRNKGRDRFIPSFEEQLSSRPIKTRIRDRPAEVSAISQQTYQLYRELHSRIRGHKGLDMDAVDVMRAELDSFNINEILDLLHVVDSSDTDHHEYISQASFIAGSLARRDPALALDTFIPRMRHNPEGTERQLSVIYSMWVRSDPAAAEAWLNAQDAAVAPAFLTKLRSLNTPKAAEQADAEQPATRSQSDSQDSYKPQPEAEGRSR